MMDIIGFIKEVEEIKRMEKFCLPGATILLWIIIGAMNFKEVNKNENKYVTVQYWCAYLMALIGLVEGLLRCIE